MFLSTSPTLRSPTRGPGTGTALWSQNTAINNVTITMNENSSTEGIYRPNGTLTANGLTITANTGIDGNGSNDSLTNVRIFSNGDGIDLNAYNGSLGSADSITDSEIVMTGASTAIVWSEGPGGSVGKLNASFLTVVGDGTAGSVGVESAEIAPSEGMSSCPTRLCKGSRRPWNAWTAVAARVASHSHTPTSTLRPTPARAPARSLPGRERSMPTQFWSRSPMVITRLRSTRR